MNIQQITEQITKLVAKSGLPPKGKCAQLTRGNEIVGFGAEQDGRLYVRREWYTPEAFGDDDDSSTGFRLPAKMGLTRNAAEVHAATVDALLPQLGKLG